MSAKFMFAEVSLFELLCGKRLVLIKHHKLSCGLRQKNLKQSCLILLAFRREKKEKSKHRKGSEEYLFNRTV